MNESRQPKGIPAGGQFAATSHPEPEARLHPAVSTGEARRIAGVRAASLILDRIPEADVLWYTHNPARGIGRLDQLRDGSGRVIYSGDDMDYPVSRTRQPKEAERRAAVREAVRLLAGPYVPPEHDAQGASAHLKHERLHLPTFLEYGPQVLDAEDLTPAQSSAQRMNATLSHWTETGGDPQTTMRDLLTDLRHYAAANNLDLGQALDGSYKVFLEEHSDPAFKEGF